jgi:predicted permease
VALIDNAVLNDNVAMATINIENYQRREGEDTSPDIASVSPGFFRAMGVRLIAGREFTDADRVDAPKVVIVNEAFVRRYFPRENPLGRRIGRGRDKPEISIAGVVATMRHRNLREADVAMYYLPYLRDPAPGSYTFYVRGAGGSASSLARTVRREVSRIAPSLPVFAMRSMDTQVDQILSVERAISTMSAFFGLLATVLAGVGLYGVMAYTVTRRTREIGIRVALGAERSTVLWLVLREVAVMAAIGTAAGLPVAVLLSRFIQSQLYGVQAHDPATYVLVVCLLLASALFAGFLPASRAARVDPITALRYE